ncbi:unnamed protein product [Cuscuta europaea]|uniref:Uncharacterized protein n=1 Tax=Cuscuta europaea TaxID=41803 RepID=A0A9P0YI07_CUSEU|nr:unnamed protein product [Cuscuta europaea]
MSDNCNFFLWEHDAKKMENVMPMDAEKITFLKENEKLIEELDKMKLENKMLLEKNCKLRMKKFLEVEGRRASSADKNAMRVVVLSCFSLLLYCPFWLVGCQNCIGVFFFFWVNQQYAYNCHEQV